MNSPEQPQRRWIDWLDDEDLAFMKRFVLCSGSLKDLAQLYDVSYPTVRLRLDRLMEKVKIYDNQEPADDFEKLLRGLYAEGKLDTTLFKQLRSGYQHQRHSTPDEKPNPSA